MSNIVLSIIIPVYNVEHYLHSCFSSFDDLLFCEEVEFIAIDDGSTDQSRQRCEQLGSKFRHFNLVSKRNGGVSSARNVGVSVASGKYVWFFDSDDFLAAASKLKLKKLIEVLRCSDVDCAFINVVRGEENAFPSFKGLGEKCSGIIQSFEESLATFLEKRKLTSYSIDKIVRADLVKCNSFDERYIMSEDFSYCMKLFARIKSYIECSDIVYVYRNQREGSATYELDEKKVKAMCSVFFDLFNWLDNSNVDEQRKQYLRLYLMRLFYTILPFVSLLPNKDHQYKQFIPVSQKLYQRVAKDCPFQIRKVHGGASYFCFTEKIIGFTWATYSYRFAFWVKNMQFWRKT